MFGIRQVADDGPYRLRQPEAGPDAGQGRAVGQTGAPGGNLSPVTSKPAGQGRMKTGHLEGLIPITFFDASKGLLNCFSPPQIRSSDSEQSRSLPWSQLFLHKVEYGG